MKKIVALFVVLLATFGLAACQEAAVELDRLTVTPPTKVEYIVGDLFNPAGMIVKAIYSDGTDATLAAADYTVSGFTSTSAGLRTVTVTYEGQTVTFGIAVFDPEAVEEALSLNVKSVPTQQIYNRQEEFDATGLVVEVVYNTGRKADLASGEYTLSGFSAGVVGKYDVVVSFETLTASFYAEVRAVTVQGVTATTVLVGNTAVLSGPLAFVGVPFRNGMMAAFEEVNEAGGIAGRTIEYINRDDGFDGTVGLTNTKQLINEDHIFALVGHFGTGTVSNTLAVIREAGIPMVYAATGVNVLYSERSPLDPVMPVQPIYLTDGRIMTARAIKEAVYGTNGDEALAAGAKIGVLYTTSNDGISIKEGIEIEARTLGVNDNFIYSSFATADIPALNAAVENFRTAGVSAIIVASNQAPFKAAIGVMETLDFNVPAFTSYVNADATAVDPATDYGFPIFTNAWVDIFSESGQVDTAAFVAAINAASFLTEDDKALMAVNSFAIAGYIAAKNFIEGLTRVGTNELTWESFIKAMESAPLNIPMGGSVDFGGGKRHGINAMSLLKYNIVTRTFDKVREIETIDEIRE
ncbi:MAG: ABC transporter substrate-binding protein [Firmicutes bacterium]|nr:ABC transporter substrate-binding protein [Bacillota bacterium]